MKGKKFFILFICGIIIVSIAIACIFETRKIQQPKVEVEETPIPVQQIEQKPVKAKPIDVKRNNLYSESLYELPLYSIAQINKLSPQVQATVNSVLEQAQGFYFLKHNRQDNSLEIILQNPIEEKQVYPRHQIQIAHINSSGVVQYKTVGYTGVEGEINAEQAENDKELWIFDEKSDVQRPVEHVVYDNDGNVAFTEKWNYDDSEEVKYEQRDSNKHLISVLKEVPNGEKYRKEHIFYDNNGHLTGSMTINYDGANICDFNYYNSKDNDGVTIINEYSDGVKTKESIYNKDYELVNTVTAEYKDGERTTVTVFDREGKETEKVSN